MPEIYTRIRLVDAIVLASPIFFMGVSAQTKAMIDRCQCFWTEKYVRGIRRYEGRRRPKGLFVSCAGSPKEVVFEPARHVVKAFFAAIDYQYAGEVLLLHTDDPDLGSRRTEALAQARVAGARLCEE
jgi:multimeric flavodoxin WrbA